MLGSLSEAGKVDGDLVVVQDLAVWEKFAIMMLGLGVRFFFFKHFENPFFSQGKQSFLVAPG